MIKYLKNNFILSALLAIVITIFVYLQKRSDDDRNNKEGSNNIKSNVMFYAKLFIVVYGLVLLVLLFKTKDYSLPFVLRGGVVKAPWTQSPTDLSIKVPTVTTDSPVSTSNNAANSSLVEDLSLNEVNIGEPDF